MKCIDIIYVSIYHWYNKMRMAGRKVNPTSMTATIFGLLIGGWSMTIMWIYYNFFAHKGFAIANS